MGAVATPGATMLRMGLVGLMLALPANTVAQPIAVPSDPRASYSAVERRSLGPDRVEIITRREGPSGVTFARREVDCRALTFRYLGEGDTLAQARRPGPPPTRMAQLVEGSISYHVVHFACAGGR